MNEILVGGIDVSKRFSDLCVLSLQNTVLVREKIYHDLTSMQRALKILQGMEQEYGHKPVLVMESTSHYHLLLDQIFPGYDKVFSDVGGVSFRAILRQFPTLAALVRTDVEDIAEAISTANRLGARFANKKADWLKECAGAAQKIGLRSASDPSVILCLVTMLDSLYACKKSLEDTMQKLIAEEMSLQNNIVSLRSIPGIGKFSSAVILAELGDISRFHKPKQLSAYFGLDPSERQSETFTGTKNKLSKRESPYARAALHMAAHNAVCKHGKALPPNPVLTDYYGRKCNEKPKKVALAAVMHKLTNIIFAVLRDQKPFEL